MKRLKGLLLVSSGDKRVNEIKKKTIINKPKRNKTIMKKRK